ncbi:M48 family metalloprotease [Reinekea marinisedimentorum]|uniref:Putative Zn-dependent protease n=1 Tax=Reinekea marinisedimentorum TaxID=230495 RepID=A0A4R3I2E5_9GAMM|nr:M48 family metalloprotease [Reinekea marinisedimentorum]TCS39956.1 putative Zn-dependent protease [Reinekea marinisedimentorum]
MDRRKFLHWAGLATTSVAIPTVFTGCAYDPVTGSPTFSLLSEEDEKQIDAAQSPMQFSVDYGPTANNELQNYVTSLGSQIAAVSHRPGMPYSFRVLDANHINAYTFPAGATGITRGIMVEMESEAELVALIGHEVGHVNARHAAERTTKGILAQAAVGAASAALGDSGYGDIVAGVGSLSATALLAKYSRNDEREADALGMEYGVKMGANPKGMVGLMEMLDGLSSAEPSTMEIMFSSHPMSSERLANANSQLSGYNQYASRNLGKERYMDYTIGLREQRAMIKALSNADLALSGGENETALEQLNIASRQGLDDYGYWVIHAKYQMATGRYKNATGSLKEAQFLKPNEVLPAYMLGISYLETSEPDAAISQFNAYKEVITNNSLVEFFIGYGYEMKGDRNSAAAAYKTYLSQVQQGDQAEYAYRRLLEWGYIS